ncbi:hypothetical protein P4O66_017174 [Electrophorus voltai]|uniref:TNFR-Cys domain-containing protein n=1 Tax=Electrophorus voltai TaxID=2609070 RepID=A0AAD8YTS4_9TELE|nr:hypothetical protein P4O66_017174 [Electrophorus voltai]
MPNAVLLFVIWMAWFVGNTENTSEICRGRRCVGADNRPCGGGHCRGAEGFAIRHFTRSAQVGAAPHTVRSDYRVSPQNRHAVSYTIIPPQHGKADSPRENPRTITAEVYNPGCKTTGCHSRDPLKPNNATKACKGIGCKLPFIVRPMPKPNSCASGDCQSGAGFVVRNPTVVHMQDRAEQALDELPEFGHVGSERGESPFGIQLRCDVKPGSNELPSEDALVLQLRLGQGQEKLAEALKEQQLQIGQLQGQLMEQQREIMEQQRQMFDLMEQVKAQYSLLLDGVRHVPFQGGTRGDPEARPESLGPQEESRFQEVYTMHKVDMEASVMEEGRPLQTCGSCGDDEYCDYRGNWPRCEKCTVCPPGFFLVSQCSFSADRICQDRDECLEIPNLCREHDQCLNMPGGFRCSSMSVKDAATGLCGPGYFYNLELQECQACSECDSQPTASPCSALSDTLCAGPSGAQMSLSWSGDVTPPRGVGFSNMQLPLQGADDSSLASATADGWLVLHQHGLVWVDNNLALRHGCQSFVQMCLQLNASEAAGSAASVRDLSGVRLEQREGGPLQSASMSGAFVADPGDALALVLRSASHRCDAEGEPVRLQGGLVSAFSLLWLSHDTGAVAMAAQAVASSQFYTNYRPAFRMSFVSDPYIVGLTHDGRSVRFAERGTVKFVLQQALYSMGQACVSEGFHLLAYVDRSGNSSELARVFKPGAHYRDMSISLSVVTTVDIGDSISFEILAPVQCTVRYFGDDSGISVLSLVWVPSSVSSAVSAAVSRTGLPTGAVRNKALLFRQTSTLVPQLGLAGTRGRHPFRNFVFRAAGVASLALDLRLIHSCGTIKLALLEQVGPQGARPTTIARQVGGQMPEGSEWASMGLRVSFSVRNGTEVFVTVDCVHGRLNQISHEAGSGISILWTAA